MQAPGGDTLRRNFQQIQEGRTLTQDISTSMHVVKDNKQAVNKNVREIPEPGPPSRPTIPHRLIGKNN